MLEEIKWLPRPTLVCFGAGAIYFALSLFFSFLRSESFYLEIGFLYFIQFCVGLLLARLINKFIYRGAAWAFLSGLLYTLIVFTITSIFYLLYVFIFSGSSAHSFNAFTLLPLVTICLNTISTLPFICLYMLFCNFFNGLNSKIERQISVLIYSLFLCLCLYIIYYKF